MGFTTASLSITHFLFSKSGLLHTHLGGHGGGGDKKYRYDLKTRLFEIRYSQPSADSFLSWLYTLPTPSASPSLWVLAGGILHAAFRSLCEKNDWACFRLL